MDTVMNMKEYNTIKAFTNMKSTYINGSKYTKYILVPSIGIAIGFAIKWVSENYNHTATKIPNALLKQRFELCCGTKRNLQRYEQRRAADEFYAEINQWSTDQLQIEGKCIVVKFLIWYYRSKFQPPLDKLTNEQAQHIRYWIEYHVTSDIKWIHYNSKCNYMYNIAFLQRSIPELKAFYEWINNIECRSIPNGKLHKQYYYLTKYQAACILGDWDKVQMLGEIIKDISVTDTDYFMQKTYKFPNFAVIFRLVHKIIREFSCLILPAPIFTTWNILCFKYRKAVDNLYDEHRYNFFFVEDFNHFMNRKLYIWGRVCQMICFLKHNNKYIAFTGSWSDTKLYMEANWTYEDRYNGIIQKHAIMKVERVPLEDEVEVVYDSGNKKIHKGYIWRGKITIHVRYQAFAQEVTINDLEVCNEIYFDGEKAYKNNEKQNQTEIEMKLRNSTVETKIYEVELIINKNRTHLN